jgi:hypothetical protein
VRVLLSVTAAIVLSACAMAEADEASRLPAVHGDLAGVLAVRCVDGEVQVDSDRVRTRPNGVHIRVEELPEDGTTVELANTDASAAPPGGGRGRAGGIGVTVLDTIAPGPVLVRCFPDDGPRHFLPAHDDDTSVAVEVVDEGGHWRSPGSWTCEYSETFLVFDYGPPPDVRERQHVPQLVDAASTHLGVPPEAVQTFGYERGTWRWAGVVQDSTLEALTSFKDTGGVWLVQTSTRCE